MKLRWLLVVLLAGLLSVVRRLSRRARAQRSARTRRAEPGDRRRPDRTSVICLIARREIRERVRSRALLVTSALILLVVAAAIIIPAHNRGRTTSITVGVVGVAPASLAGTVQRAAQSVGTTAHVSSEPSLAAAERALQHKSLDLAVIDDQRLEMLAAPGPTDTSSLAQFARSLAAQLGIARAMAQAGLNNQQISTLYGYRALPIASTGHGPSPSPRNATSILGIIVTFVMLQQYMGWILMGVMEEKTSRVIEVLLSSVRPLQLISGKVLGIGAVTLAQAGAIIAVALLVGELTGSSVLHGASPAIMASSVLWLALGYFFYSWVFAAAGAMVERQDQAQAVAFPLSLPIIFGYVYALVQTSATSISLLTKVLAYLPPTAPFLMPALVGRHAVSWWEFLLGVVVDLASTVALARLAAKVYERAILRTGTRVRWRDVWKERGTGEHPKAPVTKAL